MKTVKRELVRKDPAGYEIWRETCILPTDGAKVMDGGPETPDTSEIIESIEQASGETVTMEIAYTPSGSYIGNEKRAALLCGKYGIAPELPDANHNVCCIGFSKRDQKWWGWSHRAMYGFKIGDIAKEGDCVCVSGWAQEYLDEHPEEDISLPVGFEAKTLDDAKLMAIAFAESVS